MPPINPMCISNLPQVTDPRCHGHQRLDIMGDIGISDPERSESAFLSTDDEPRPAESVAILARRWRSGCATTAPYPGDFELGEMHARRRQRHTPLPQRVRP